MKIEFVKPTIGNYDDEMASYITEGKVYPVIEVMSGITNNWVAAIKDDAGERALVIVNSPSAHLRYKGMFIPCDEKGELITNNRN